MAIVDIASATVTDIVPLGTIDHSRDGFGFDASDEDGAVDISPRPTTGLYLPDSIDSFTSGGQTYLSTANEGDAREYDCFAEEVRVKDVTLDPTAFPDAAELQADENLGRLNITATLGQDDDGEYSELFSFGGRSISVRDASGALVWDSSDTLEQLLASKAPEFFNADNTENGADSRSDAKGPEPEGIEIAQIGDSAFAFVGLERPGGIAVFDLSTPSAPQLVEYATTRIADGDPEAGTAGDLGPEGLFFVSATDSPTGQPLLIVGNEVSGTTTVFSIDGLPAEPTQPGPNPPVVDPPVTTPPGQNPRFPRVDTGA